MKKILISLVVIAAVLMALAWFTLSNLDSIVKSIIEDTGSRVFDTQVTVAEVEVRLKQGQATVRGLTVANPPGYSSAPAIEFGEITARIDRQTRNIELVRVLEPVVRVELKGADSNFAVLHQNAAGPLRRGAPDGDQRGDSQRQRKSTGTNNEDAAADGQDLLTINRLEIADTRMLVSADWLDKTRELTLDRLEFTDLEANPDTIARVVLSEFLNRIIKTAGKELMKSKLQQELEEKGLDKLKDLLK